MKSLLFSVVFILGVYNIWAAVYNESTDHDHQFDVLIFTQHWPNTVCIQWKDKVENHTCLLMQQWGVHGVWPTKLGTIGPGFCNNSWHFHPNELEPIQQQLESFWPNIENGTAEDSLWKHEWQKHGTCAAQLPSLDSELKYFSQGLTWLAQHDMTNILNKAGIYASPYKTYTVQEIWQAVKGATNTNPGIECFNDPNTGDTYLFEIRICFDKQLRLVNCDGIKGTVQNDIITNCPAEKSIIKYPNSVPGAVDPNQLKQGWGWRDFLEFILFLQWLTF